mmetsp:Transcript_19113/g.54882  ORF Transcript_19113/g.54882 Transcript_19113/m.54882 type:complete len:207 (-) Transcript_19113:156-776(-)
MCVIAVFSICRNCSSFIAFWNLEVYTDCPNSQRHSSATEQRVRTTASLMYNDAKRKLENVVVKLYSSGALCTTPPARWTSFTGHNANHGACLAKGFSSGSSSSSTSTSSKICHPSLLPLAVPPLLAPSVMGGFQLSPPAKGSPDSDLRDWFTSGWWMKTILFIVRAKSKFASVTRSFTAGSRLPSFKALGYFARASIRCTWSTSRH